MDPPRRRHHPPKTTRRQVHLSISVLAAYFSVGGKYNSTHTACCLLLKPWCHNLRNRSLPDAVARRYPRTRNGAPKCA
jgi:hypothetical protein